MARIRSRRRAALLLLGFLLAPRPGHGEGVALTFDDVPINGVLVAGTTNADLVAQVVTELSSHGAPPSFGFVNGSRLEGNPDAAAALQRWVAGGQRIGNHAYAHTNLDDEPVERFLEDVRRNEPVLELATDTDWHWLRYPFLHEGETAARQHEVRGDLESRGYRIAEVTLDFEDWLWNEAYPRCVASGDKSAIATLRAQYLEAAAASIDEQRTVARALFGRDIDHVLLLHLGAFSPVILPELLVLLKDKGFTLVPLEQAARDPAYAAEPTTERRTGTLLDQWMRARGMPARRGMPVIHAAVATACRSRR